jgi:hypothetical protein
MRVGTHHRVYKRGLQDRNVLLGSPAHAMAVYLRKAARNLKRVPVEFVKRYI